MLKPQEVAHNYCQICRRIVYFLIHVGIWGWSMKFCAFFAVSSVLTATIAGGDAAFMLGNLGALAGAGSLMLATLNLQKAG